MANFKSLILDNGIVKKILSTGTLEVGAGIVASGTSLSLDVAQDPNGATGSIDIGALAGEVNIGALNKSVNILGDLDVAGNMTVHGSSEFVQDATIDGNTIINGNLTIGNDAEDVTSFYRGSVTFESTLDANVTFNKAADFTAAVSMGSTLGVSGAATFDSAVDINSTLDVANNAMFGSDVGITGNLGVTGAANLKSTLDVAGNGTFASNLGVSGDLGVTGATNLKSTLDVSGIATFGNNVGISGDLGVTGAVDLKSTLDVAGNVTLASNLGVSGDLGVTGKSELLGTLSVGDDAEFKANVGISGDLGVTGAADLKSTLDVSGIATFGNNVGISGSLGVTGATQLLSTLGVSGAATFDSSVTLNSDLGVSGNLGVTGNAFFYSDVTIGDTGTDRLYVNAKVGSDLTFADSMEIKLEGSTIISATSAGSELVGISSGADMSISAGDELDVAATTISLGATGNMTDTVGGTYTLTQGGNDGGTVLEAMLISDPNAPNGPQLQAVTLSSANTLDLSAGSSLSIDAFSTLALTADSLSAQGYSDITLVQGSGQGNEVFKAMLDANSNQVVAVKHMFNASGDQSHIDMLKGETVVIPGEYDPDKGVTGPNQYYQNVTLQSPSGKVNVNGGFTTISSADQTVISSLNNVYGYIGESQFLSAEAGLGNVSLSATNNLSLNSSHVSALVNNVPVFNSIVDEQAVIKTSIVGNQVNLFGSEYINFTINDANSSEASALDIHVVNGSNLITINAGFTLETSGSGNINLPNNVDAKFQIEGVSVGSTVTSANLDTLTNNGDASALHYHIGGESTSIFAVKTSLVDGTIAVNAPVMMSYIDNTAGVVKASASSDSVVFGFAAANMSLGESGHIIVAGELTNMAASLFTGDNPTGNDIGKPVYLSTVPGQLTLTAPSANNTYMVKVGVLSGISTVNNVNTYSMVIRMGEPVYNNS